jgi:hypothetical protein
MFFTCLCKIYPEWVRAKKFTRMCLFSNGMVPVWYYLNKMFLSWQTLYLGYRKAKLHLKIEKSVEVLEVLSGRK